MSDFVKQRASEILHHLQDYVHISSAATVEFIHNLLCTSSLETFNLARIQLLQELKADRINLQRELLLSKLPKKEQDKIKILIEYLDSLIKLREDSDEKI